ncbi:MAG: SEC-C metal-binding domain-containing protein [Cupriavidus necator]
MIAKVGRNDPCPCGSGKKYKHCCLLPQEAPAVEPKEHEGAVGRAIDWLFERHRKSTQTALDELLEDMLGEAQRDQLVAEADEESWVGIQINLMEWLLAEGELQVKGVRRRVCEYLLGPGGPLLTVGQRDWLQQLTQRPLRLYDVTDVVPGVQMTLCDALDTDAPPILVQERSGTQTLTPGTTLGCRIMRVREHFELSGAVYPFSMLAAPAVVATLRAAAEEYGPREGLAALLGTMIMSAWVRQYVAPPPMPTLMDAHSQEPLVLITDHYEVSDWQALTDALTACADVHGDRGHGWDRLIECKDGQTRSIATVNLGKDAQRIAVFYKTQRYADEGRAWFDGVAGGAVKLLTRELQDPRALMTQAPSGTAKPAVAKSVPDIEPQALSQAIEATLRRSYASWADEPIPALDHKTPRQALQTPAGLERVKGLIRSYEAGEERMAAQQGRPEVSYAFLWEAIGLTP